MKHILLAILLLFFVGEALASPPKKYKVHIVTWDKSRVTGRLESINDSSISIKTNNGKIYTFSPMQTKHLKIWRPGINLPFAAAGCIGLTLIFRSLAADKDGLSKLIANYYGITLGTLGGLIAGDLISTKYNKRSLHFTDYKLVTEALAVSK